MQEKIIEELRQELKAQIEENKELNDSITWWKNRYEAQVKINKEHQKLNGELRKENDTLITVIDLVREYLYTHKLYSFKYDDEELFEVTTDKKAKDDLLEILERVNEE